MSSNSSSVSAFLYEILPWLRERVSHAFADPTLSSTGAAGGGHAFLVGETEKERMENICREIQENQSSEYVRLYRNMCEQYRDLEPRFFEGMHQLITKQKLPSHWSLWLVSRPDTLWDTLFVNRSLLLHWSSCAVQEYRQNLELWMDWVAVRLRHLEEEHWFQDFVETVGNPHFTVLRVTPVLAMDTRIAAGHETASWVEVRIEDPMDGDVVECTFCFVPQTREIVISDPGCRLIRVYPSPSRSSFPLYSSKTTTSSSHTTDAAIDVGKRLSPSSRFSWRRRFLFDRLHGDDMVVSRYWPRSPSTSRDANHHHPHHHPETVKPNPYDGWDFRFASRYSKVGYDIYQVLSVLFVERLASIDPVFADFHAAYRIIIPPDLLYNVPPEWTEEQILGTPSTSTTHSNHHDHHHSTPDGSSDDAPPMDNMEHLLSEVESLVQTVTADCHCDAQTSSGQESGSSIH